MLEDDLTRRQREIEARFGKGVDLQSILQPLHDAPAIKRYVAGFSDIPAEGRSGRVPRDSVTNRLYRYFEAAAYEGPDAQAKFRQNLIAQHEAAGGDIEALAVVIKTAQAYFQAIPCPAGG